MSVLLGGPAGGDVASLSADDGTYYVLSSLNSGAQWSASFLGLPASVGALTVTYDGHASMPCTQNVNLWNWYYNAWVPIAHTTAGSSDTTLSLAAPGLLSDYVFLGELRVSVQCFRTDSAAFDLSSDLVRIQYS